MLITHETRAPTLAKKALPLAEGFALIAASIAQQVAQEWKERARCLYYLLEGLSGRADRGGKKFVTVELAIH